MKFNRIIAVLKIILVAAPVLIAALYAADYLWLRLRMNRPDAGQALATIQFYWATPIKGGKEEIFFDQPQTETCVRSLFPHLGHNPCWYCEDKTVRVIR